MPHFFRKRRKYYLWFRIPEFFFIIIFEWTWFMEINSTYGCFDEHEKPLFSEKKNTDGWSFWYQR